MGCAIRTDLAAIVAHRSGAMHIGRSINDGLTRLTLREMVDRGQHIRLHCADCYRDRTILLATLLSEQDIEANLSSRQIEKRIRCTRCNGMNVVVMAPSHDMGVKLDERQLRLQSNVKGVHCPECGSGAVSRSGPLRFQDFHHHHHLTGMVFQYECEDCGNWWSAG